MEEIKRIDIIEDKIKWCPVCNKLMFFISGNFEEVGKRYLKVICKVCDRIDKVFIEVPNDGI